MSTDVVVEFVGDVAIDRKQTAEREYEIARGRVEQARRDLAAAQVALVQARAERREARAEYEEQVRARRKPRQTNIVRRILAEIAANPMDRKSIVDKTGLDATTVSSTLTRLRRAGFVHRDGTDYAGKWTATPAGVAFRDSDAPFPKEHRG